MKIIKFLYCLAIMFIFGAQIVSAQYNSELFAPGELLVKYKNNPKAASAARLMNAGFGSTVLEEFPDLGWQRVKLPADLPVNQAVSAYQSNDEVEAAQPNFYYHLLNTSNDARFSELYGLQKISAPAAWDFSVGSSSVVVADIDTGINYNHEDLSANMWRNPGETPNNGIDDDGNGFVDDYYGYDFFYNDSNPIDDAGGHGTHTGGTIGAAGNNSLGVVGVNWTVKIMAIKIYSPNGGDTTSAMLINAYNYIRMMKNRGVNIRVTNNSYGGCGEACGYDQATKDAIDALGEAGILQVFAAGNSGVNIDSTPFYPASYTSPSILTVAASNENDNRAGFSNYGAASVDLAAPGLGILSTYNTNNSAYATLSGTSMATPHVSGAAALLAAYNPNLTAASIKATLMNTVDQFGQWNGVVKTGGRLNIGRALQNQTVCTFELSQTTQNASASGGEYSFGVTAPTNCDYSAISNSNWVSINRIGSGNSTFTYSVAANSGTARTQTISVAGQIFTVNQSAAPSYEADVSPRGTGDGRVSSTDVSTIQGFQLGIGLPYQSNEFQRADCAPFSSKGDGRVTSIDVSQAQGYQLGLNLTGENALQPTAGPTAPLNSGNSSNVWLLSNKIFKSAFEFSQTELREVRVTPTMTSAGQTVIVPIAVDAMGDESVYGFSLSYDSTKLSNPVVTIGNAGGSVSSNTTQSGQIGVSVTYGGGTITAGNNKVLINVQFMVANNATAGQIPISFTDTPTIREVASAPGAAGGVAALSATFTNGALNLTSVKSRKRARFF